MAMTEEERRQARNEASRRCREARKAVMNKAGTKPVKKPGRKPAGTKTPDTKKLAVKVEKFAAKCAKPTETYATLVKSAADLLGEIYKAGDEKLAVKTRKAFEKKLSLEADIQPENGRVELKSVVSAKARIPKAAKPSSDPQPEAEKVVPIDPSLLTGVEDGSVTAADIDCVTEDSDCPEDAERPSWADKDLDEMTDEEREEYDMAQDEELDEDYTSGRADMLREMEEQGGFDFEN